MRSPNYDNKIVLFKCCGCKIYKPTENMCVECRRRREQALKPEELAKER